jgi:DUF4097 and DUF4098 domain-containing protein YvlB
MRSIRPRFALLALAACVSTACSIDLDAAQYTAKEEKSFTVTGKAEISLKTFDGSIAVMAWDKSQVALTIERHAGSQAEAEALKVKTEQDGNRIIIEAVKPEGSDGVHVGWHAGRSVSFVLHVPKQTDLTASSGDGSIDATGVTGTVQLRSGDGSIKAADLVGDVTVHTGDGSIDAQNVTGALDVSTGDGSVSISGAPKALKARTGDGAVNLKVASVGSPSEDWDISTGDGSVTVNLPTGFNAQLDAHTGDGSISADDFGLRPTGEDKNNLQGTLGSGGRTLRIRSGDGSIHVGKQ